MSDVIIKNGKDLSHANNFHKNLRIWLNIFWVAFTIVRPPTFLTMLTPTRSICYSS